MSQIQYKFKKDDEYYTPKYAVVPIAKRIPPGSVIWCPFDQEGSEFVKVLSERGNKVIHTHILEGVDFFSAKVPECDFIVSNPPYSKKETVFERLYAIGKPFAMLVNMQGLFDSKKRFEMFKENRVEIMVLSPRVDYINPEGMRKTGVPFQSVYVCNGIFDNQLNFERINK